MHENIRGRLRRMENNAITFLDLAKTHYHLASVLAAIHAMHVDR